MERWLCALFLSCLLLPAQPFEGTFAGQLPEGEMRLILRNAGETVDGELHALGAVLALRGQPQDGVLRGVVSLGDASGQFEARRSAGGLTLRLDVEGEVDEYELQAVGGAPAPGPAPAPAPGRSTAPSGAASPAPQTQPAAPAGASQVEDRRLGLRFRIPEGWVGRQTEAGYLLGSNTQPGIIVVMPHTLTSVDALKQQAAQGWIDPADQVNLPAAGQVRQAGSNGVAVDLSGTVQADRAKAHAIGLVSPHGGGVFIVAGTSEEKYGPQYEQVTKQIAASFEFFPSEAPKEAEAWTERFRGRCVAYMKSDYSSGPSVGGFSTGSGWSEKRFLYLFPDGSFQATGSFSGSFDSGGGFGSVNTGPQNQSGAWKVIDQAGQSHLVLEHTGGGRETFALSRQGSQTFLNGRRWFVVSHQECN
jgi:hypothetical protein